LPVSASKR